MGFIESLKTRLGLVDEYQKAVGDAVSAVRSGDDAKIKAAFDGFNTLSAEDIVAELCNWIEDATADQDVDRLLARTTMPLPDNPKVLIEGVASNSLRAMFTYADGNIGKLISSMVLLIAALQETTESA